MVFRVIGCLEPDVKGYSNRRCQTRKSSPAVRMLLLANVITAATATSFPTPVAASYAIVAGDQKNTRRRL